MLETEKVIIRSFEDLRAWQEAHALVISIYKKTKDFPKEEVFGLTSQMRRAAVSIASNIAEGFSRKTPKDKSQFYAIGKGSLTELQSQLYVARDVGYLSGESCKTVLDQMYIVGRLLTGLQKSMSNTQV